MKNNYLSLDTETGGIGLDKSLLTAGFILADDNFKEIDRLELCIKPNDGIYHITAEGMEVNRLDIVRHNTRSITEKEAATKLYQKLDQWTMSGRDKLIPLGKQVTGDINQIWDKLITKGNWEKFVSYKILEISSVVWLMEKLGLLPCSNASLSDLANYYKIDTLGLHEAIVDAHITLRVYEAMFKDIKGKIYYGNTI